MGPNTYVPISWFCKKQGSVSNSSTESELISLDAALRMVGIPALELWDTVIDVFCSLTPAQLPIEKKPELNSIYDHLKAVDYVPPNVPLPNGRACLILLEDNDPVIQIFIKGRNPTLRHVARVHRVNTDACYERIREDPGIYMRYWPTKYQLADILTKGSFTKQSWDTLLELLQIRANTSEAKTSPQVAKKQRRNTKQTSGLTEGKSPTPSSTLEIGGLREIDHIVSV